MALIRATLRDERRSIAQRRSLLRVQSITQQGGFVFPVPAPGQWSQLTPELAQQIAKSSLNALALFATTSIANGKLPVLPANELQADQDERGHPAHILYTSRVRALAIQTGDDTHAFDLDQLDPQHQGLLVRSILAAPFVAEHANACELHLLAHWKQLALPGVLPEHRGERIDLTALAMATAPHVPLLNAAREQSEEDKFSHAALCHALQITHHPLNLRLRDWLMPHLSLEQFKHCRSKAQETAQIASVLGFLAPVPKQDKRWAYSEHHKPGKLTDLPERLKALEASDAPLFMSEPLFVGGCAVGPALRTASLLAGMTTPMLSNGLPWSPAVADKLMLDSQRHLARIADEIACLAPALLAPTESAAQAKASLQAPAQDANKEAFACVAKELRAQGCTLPEPNAQGHVSLAKGILRQALLNPSVTPTGQALAKLWIELQQYKNVCQQLNSIAPHVSTHEGQTRLFSNIRLGPHTGRYKATDPAVHGFPSKQSFRNCIQAKAKHLLISADFNAMDMRSGAALAVRAQRQIFKVADGTLNLHRSHPFGQDILLTIQHVLGKVERHQIKAYCAQQEGVMARISEELATPVPTEIRDKDYWKARETQQNTLKLARFARALALTKLRSNEEADHSCLRDTFNTPGLDIHALAGMLVDGHDPRTKASSPKALVAAVSKYAQHHPQSRQRGKTLNLSLLYEMSEQGLRRDAEQKYNVVMSEQESVVFKRRWLDSFIEIDLWQAWTDLKPRDKVMAWNADRQRATLVPIYPCDTLGGRRLYATSLNAALAYEDQSSGADIMGIAFDLLQRNHPEIAKAIVLQVHDEVVIQAPEHQAVQWARHLKQCMSQAAQVLLEPYGVPSSVSLTMGRAWRKEPHINERAQQALGLREDQALELTQAILSTQQHRREQALELFEQHAAGKVLDATLVKDLRTLQRQTVPVMEEHRSVSTSNSVFMRP